MIRGVDPNTGEAVSYTGSTIQELKARLGKHKWRGLIKAESTTIDIEEVRAEPNVKASGRGTVRSAKNEAVRAHEEATRQKVAKEPARPLNEVRAATEEHAEAWRKTHNVTAQNPQRIKGQGSPRVPGSSGAASTITEAATEATVAGSVSARSAPAAEAASTESTVAGRAAAARVSGSSGLKAGAAGLSGVLALHGALEYVREKNAEKYIEGPLILEDEGGAFVLQYGRESWFHHIYQKEYIRGERKGDVVALEKKEYLELEEEAEALWGKKDFFGNWVPGKLLKKLPGMGKPNED